ncbi:MAG: SMI1/KNR4 family protein, partial [Luteolibacter sp.]
EETTSWFRAWTGNDKADGTSFRVFGQDGAGGCSAFWIIHPDKGLLEQPIVFLSSEGNTGVVAVNFDAYLWLLASGVGPFEAVVFGASDGSPNEKFAEFAQEHSSSEPMNARDVLDQARTRYPDFTAQIEALCL